MGILDDLAMGFGLKERTEDYDARTARTLALNEQYKNEEDRLRARASGAYNIGTGRAAQYLGSRGYDEGYTPQILDDNRPFMQRLLFSQESDLISPTPRGFAGPIGLFMNILSGGQRNVPTVSADTSQMRVRPQSGYNLGGNAQPGTRFDTRTEAEPIDYSDGILVQDPATIAAVEALNSVPDAPIAATLEPTRDEMLEALYELTGDYQGTFYTDDELRDAYKKHVINGVPVPFDRKKVPPLLADPTGAQRLPQADPARILVDDSNIPTYLPNDALVSPAFGTGNTGYYDQQMNMGVGTDQLFTPPPIGMRLITSGPHAGKYIDANGQIRVM